MKTLLVKLMGLYLNALALVAPQKAGQKGFLLFCRPFRSKITQKQKEFFNTAGRYTIEFEDNTIQAYRWGNGEKKIVFLHGWQSHTYRWKAYIDSLPKDEYTIYSLDAPGHGLSSGDFLSVPVYGALIHKFIIELGEVHTIIGHSVGGFSLLYTFYRYPLLSVRKVILMSPPGEAIDFMNFYRDTLKLSDRAVKNIIEYFTKTYDAGPEFFSTQKFAASLNINGLIIHDEDDPEAPYHYAVAINKVWKRSTLITTKGYGHNLKSSKVVEYTRNFINQPETMVSEGTQEIGHL
jgi:hypothetical protein